MGNVGLQPAFPCSPAMFEREFGVAHSTLDHQPQILNFDLRFLLVGGFNPLKNSSQLG